MYATGIIPAFPMLRAEARVAVVMRVEKVAVWDPVRLLAVSFKIFHL